MPMPVMDIGEMRVGMRQRRMLVRVAMRLLAVPRKIMGVLVMGIVAVCMRMRHRHMGMRMRVRLRQMQPNARAH